MAAPIKKDPRPTIPPLRPDLEPDDEWKEMLRRNIQEVLLSMAEDSRQKVNGELTKGVSRFEERRLTDEYYAALKNIRKLGEEQFQIALERERQERRWASGQQLHPAWSEILMTEQRAILDSIEREKRNKAPATSLRPDRTRPPPPPYQHQSRVDVPPSGSSTWTPGRHYREVGRVVRLPTQAANREQDTGPYFSYPVSQERDELVASADVTSVRPTHDVRAGVSISTTFRRAPSIPDAEEHFLEDFEPSLISDEPQLLPRPTMSPGPPYLTRTESIRCEPSTNARSVVQKFWTPSITREEDEKMSRPFVVPAKRISTASTMSTFKPPSILSVTFTDPLAALAADVNRERSGTYSTCQEWPSPDPARRDSGREGPLNGYTYDRLDHGSNQEPEDCATLSQPSAPYPRPVTSTRLGDNSRAYNAEAQVREEEKEEEKESRKLEMERKEEEVRRREREVNSREMMARQREEEARRKEEEAQRKMEEALLKAEETRKKEEELRKREDDLRHREEILNRRGRDAS